MKYLFVSLFLLIAVFVNAQADKSKRPSPPAVVTETTNNGLVITIDYSQPSLKGRRIGSDIAPYGEVWRTGANEATVFEISKDAKINGQDLPAGKYGLYSIPGEKEWTIIFNKTWKTWGTNYKESDDALRIKVKPAKNEIDIEKMTFSVTKAGKVQLAWGKEIISFQVQ